MIKKITLLIFIFCMIISNLSFAQVDNPYVAFSPEQLKTNKDYVKNFNPGNFSTKILYNCMIDMVNLARKEYSFVDPLLHNIKMDSTAQMQADYQALKNEKTEFNAPPYKTVFFRLKKYGLTYHGIEILSKAKASFGTEEYSYYDLCLELIRPILKNIKTADQLLDKSYTYIGFGYETDEFMKTMYISLILGNDLTFNENKPSPLDKNLPFSKSKGALTYYDDKICSKCNSDKNLEILSGYFKVRESDVILDCDDAKLLKRLIGKDGDAIVLDFVQLSQYGCEGNVIDNDRLNRGFITKPITFEKILAANEIADKKSPKLIAKIAPIPEEISTDAEFEIVVIMIKEGKYACRNIIKKSIEYKNADYDEKVNFLIDETSIKSAGEWVATAEEGTLEIKLPFDVKKTEYRYSDFDTLITRLYEPEFVINKVEIIAHNSLNYANDAVQMKIQKKRAESIAKAFVAQYPGVATEIKYDDSWEDFKKDLVYSEDFYDLVLGKKEDAVKKLKENNGKAAKALESYLVKHRYAHIILHVTYKIDGKNEQEFAVSKFNKAVAKGNLPLAMAIQKYMIKQVESGNYSLNAINKMQIPELKTHQALLNNKLYMQYFLSPRLSDKMRFEMNTVYNLNPTNQIVTFNKNLCDVYNATFNSVADITKLQQNIDKLYTFVILPKDRINSLNLELQLKIINYLNSAPKTTENATLLTTTYAKIKAIRNPKLDSWQNAYKLAAVFAKDMDYRYALDLMDPFLNDPTISEDFIFSYVSIGAHRQETYLGSLFTKAVKLAAEKNPVRLCTLFDKLSITVNDNREVQKTVCKACNK